MTSLWDYNATPSNNTGSQPSGFGEGQQASQVDDMFRAMLGELTEFAHSQVAGGTGDALTVTYTNVPASLTDGMQIHLRAAAANTLTNPTLAVNGGSTHPITKLGGTALVAGDIAGNLHELTLRWNNANSRWELLNPKFPVAAIGSGTSGGVPYYNSSTTLASSGALTANAPVVGGGAGAAPTTGLSVLTNSLGGDVPLNNVAAYFDGPSVAQGTTGTWFASGAVTVNDPGVGATYDCKLWDGATVIASVRAQTTASAPALSIALSGYLASPAGNIRISVKANDTSALIKFNASGNSKDSTISVCRIA